jgi:hypothetical protein
MLDGFPRSRPLATIISLLVAAVAGFYVGRGVAPGAPSARASDAASRPTVSLIDVGGIYVAETGIDLGDLPPSQLPYPYTERPVPPEDATAVDGAYLRIIPLEDLGPPKLALPLQCLRCIPFRVAPGVSTLILYHGRYFLHQHLSDFRALGFFDVRGRRITFFDDPNCPTSEGVYRWERSGRGLSLEVIHDPCPFDQLRAVNLTTSAWTAFDHCIFRFVGLWPGQLGCQHRVFEP